ncbi:MAG: hypothetical protein JST64_12465, partial [Actinobacteria bacterium]|nr:hypothetical protein [Actinomycetota bacterium]
MARRDSSTTAAVLSSGGRLPVLALRRDPRDGELLRSLLGTSGRVDLDVVGPDRLVRTPLRWPSDPRAVPLALCLVVRDRPGTVAAVERLTHHVGEIPVVAVVDGDCDLDGAAEDVAERRSPGTRDLLDELVAVGVDALVPGEDVTGPMLEQAVVAAID